MPSIFDTLGPVQGSSNPSIFSTPVKRQSTDSIFSGLESPAGKKLSTYDKIDDIPVVGEVAGALEGLSRMGVQFIGVGTSQLAKVTGAVDEEFVKDVGENEWFKPKLQTGKDIQMWIGKAMDKYYSATEGVAESIVNQIPGNVAPLEGIVGAGLETAREAIPLVLPGLIPYIPKFVRNKTKEAELPGIPAPAGDVKKETINFGEFEQAYKAEQPKASRIEIAEAWGEYTGGGLRDAYKILESLPPAKRRVSDTEIQAPISSGSRPLSFKEQLEAIKESPITLTKQEFAQGVKTAGYSRRVSELKTERAALQRLVPELYDKKKIKTIESRISEISDTLKEMAGDIRSRKTQKFIDEAYDKYLKERGIPYDDIYKAREAEIAALKSMQEDKAWNVYTLQTGTTKIAEAMRLADSPVEFVMKARDELKKVYDSNEPLPTPEATDATTLLQEGRKYVESKTQKPEEQKRNETPFVNELQKELQEIYKPGMPYDVFKSSLKGKLSGLPDVVVQSVYSKIHKPSKQYGKKVVSDYEKSIPLSQAEHPLISGAIYNYMGKPIGMLFNKAKYSPKLQQILDLILHREIQQYAPGEFRKTEPLVLAQRAQLAEWSLRIQNAYDKAQVALGGGNFVGIKNLIPNILGGWGAKSLPKKINDQLFDLMNGKKIPEASPAVLELAAELRKIENDFFEYVKSSGVNIEYLPNHLARMWIPEKIKAMQPEFEAMLLRRGYKPVEIENIVSSLVANGGMVEFPVRDGKLRGKWFKQDARYSRLAHNVELSRKLMNLSVDDIRPYVNSNVHSVMSKYLDQGTRRAEFSRRFGFNQDKLDAMLLEAQKELLEKGQPLSVQEAKRIYDIIDAFQGLYNTNTIGLKAKHAMRWSVALSNFMLLPYAALRSLPEVAMPLIDGSIRAYAKAMPTAAATLIRDSLRTNITKAIPKNELMEFAESIGKAGEAMTAERINQITSGLDPHALDAFTFSTNMLHSWSKFMHYLTIETFRNDAFRYAKAWANGKKPSYHQERLYNYLGLNPKDLAEWHKRGLGEKDPYYKEIKTAAQIFTEDAVLTNNPATRPLWMNDPKWMMVANLKSYPTLMGNKFGKRYIVDLTDNMKHITDISNQNWPKLAVVGFSMIIISRYMMDLIDYIQYGSDGNPRTRGLKEHEKWQIAIRYSGLGGQVGTMVDALSIADYADLGYASVIGAPGATPFIMGAETLEGMREWNANKVANPLSFLADRTLAIARKFGIMEADTLSKKEIKQWLADLFHEYLGMETTSTGGVQAVKPVGK